MKRDFKHNGNRFSIVNRFIGNMEINSFNMKYDIRMFDTALNGWTRCIFRLNGTASPRQRKGCPLQTGSLLLVNSGYACSFHSVQGGTPYE